MRACLVLLFACGCSGQKNEQPAERELPRRVLQPAPERVVAVAPHNIHKAGMGPYKLGASLQEVLNLLPQFPPVELMKHEGWFDYSVVRAEAGKLVVGVEPGAGVEFVAALDSEVARTNKDVGVGATRKKLADTFGELSGSFLAIRDPRILAYDTAKQTRFVAFGAHVNAVVVGGELPKASEFRPTCKGWQTVDVAAVREAVRLPQARIFGMCLDGRLAALARHRNRLALLVKEGDKWQRLAAITAPDLVFAAPLDVDSNGNQEVAVVSIRRDDERLSSRIRILAWDGSRWAVKFDHRPYELEASSAGWTGPRLSETELLLELSADKGGLVVGGLYVERADREVRNLVPLTPRTYQVRDLAPPVLAP